MAKKRLMMAVGALAMAVGVSVSSTYAWFSMNSTVTASSMVVKATTDANLYIAKGASVAIASVTGTDVSDLGVTNTALKPAEMSDSSGTVTVKAATGYSTEPTVGTAGTANAWATIGTITATAATDATSPAYDLDDYCAYGYVTIARKQTVAGTYKIAPTCTVSCTAASNLNKSMRAGIIINGALYESNDANSDGASDITFTFDNIVGLDDNVAYSAALLVWFEGEDSDCFVNNAISLSNNTAAWSFVSSDYVATP